MNETSSLVEQAEKFLKSCKATLKIENCYPNEYADNKSPRYRYVITRRGKQLSGLYSSKLCIKPTAYDILKSLPMCEPEIDLWDFAKRHEYQIDGQTDYDFVLNAYKEYCHDWRGVNKLFGDIFEEFIKLFEEETK